MLKTIDRLALFIKYSGLSARKFDLSIGASNGYTLNMQKNNASIGSDIIEKIARTYPELNLVWLITGDGEIFNTDDKPVPEFKDLPEGKKIEIERIIENKIKQRQKQELKRLLEEVTKEFERRQNLIDDTRE